jgi:hypothetical protein
MRQGLVDILGLLGFAAFIYGLWQMWHPLAWVVGGMLALGYALQEARARAAPSAPDGQ